MFLELKTNYQLTDAHTVTVHAARLAKLTEDRILLRAPSTYYKNRFSFFP